MIVNHDQAESIVKSNRELFWDGWTIVSWYRNPEGYSSKYGMFRKGSWGIARRFPMKSDGTWEIQNKYVKNT
jgi:hypothetical protein